MPRTRRGQILAAPHVTLLPQATTKGGVAVVVLAAAKRQLVVTMSGLPALPPGKVYQLWLIGPTRIVSAGLLPAAQDGSTPPVLASGIVTGDKLGLTVEPAPGEAAHHHPDPGPAPALLDPGPGPHQQPALAGHEQPGRVLGQPREGFRFWPGQLQLVIWPPVMVTLTAGCASSAQSV